MIYDFKKYIDTDDKLIVSKDANDKKEMYKLSRCQRFDFEKIASAMFGLE